MTEANAEAKSDSVPLIEVTNLCRSYGSVRAVKSLSFQVNRGEIVGFLGPNGAGKSTTLRMLVGFLGPSSGQVKIAGHDVVQQPVLARRAIGYLPETTALYPEMRVGEYLRFRAELKGLSRKVRREHVDNCMRKTEVLDVAHRLIGALSKGYRQRVALADALLGDPPLLILDEPTAGLDPNQIRSVRELIRELGREHTVLLSTHILSEVESTCTRVMVINQGRLVAQGPLSEITRKIGCTEVSLTVLDHAEAAQLELEAMIGVDGVEVEPPSSDSQQGLNIRRFRVQLSPEVTDTDMAVQMIVTGLVEADIGVRGARLVETRLEDVFQRLTQNQEES